MKRIDWVGFVISLTFFVVYLAFIIGTVVAWFFLLKDNTTIGDIVITVILTIFTPFFGVYLVKYFNLMKDAIN